ncbi:type VII secretion target [Mycolicibacterium sp. 050232]|uniref:type VII secretion target n=1 Tax=Mycolicibacterium sp. 050232 TaxID=3113982 RepID=UPI002E2A881E|nr:type VII secretion target [Mycolicibacterium sp. 050232]MED5811317.1 type VII secretion target [Mycolicibacterium sp. 050232]
MSANLRVAPAQLSAAATAQAEVAAAVSALGAGQSMASASGGVSDLASGAACSFVAAVLDKATTTVNDELTMHKDRLTAAADRYRQGDEEFGRRIRRIGG